MEMPIFKGAVREGIANQAAQFKKITDTNYTLSLRGRDFNVILGGNNQVQEVTEALDSTAGLFHCLISFLKRLPLGTTSTRIRDVLNENDFSISNYLTKQSSMQPNERDFLKSGSTSNYGSNDHQQNSVGTPSIGTNSTNVQSVTEVEGSPKSKKVEIGTVKVEGDNCATLNQDEHALLEMLKDEHDVSDIMAETIEDDVEVIPPSAMRERSGSMLIRAKYERDNLNSGKLILIDEEDRPEYSFETAFNKEDERIRKAETLEKRSKVLTCKTSHNENHFFHRPSLHPDNIEDLTKLSETAKVTVVGCKKIPLGRRTYYQLNPDEDDVNMVYEPAEEPKYRMLGAVEGSEEKVVRIDERFVSLKRSERLAGKYTRQDREMMERRHEVVKDHKCVCKAWVVDDDTVIAEYGGRDVKKFHRRQEHELKKEQILPFLQLIKDVHEKGYRFCSISNHNLLCSGIGRSVKFTGWKYLSGNGLGEYEYKMEDSHLMPKIMKEWVNSARSDVDLLERAKVAEQHAVLMMACESMSAPIARAINGDGVENEKSMLTQQNKKYFVKWVQENIKSDHREEVLLFLYSPTTRKLRNELADIFK